MKIKDYQFLSTEKGVLLDSNNELFSFEDLITIKTPKEIRIKDFCFLSEKEGVIISETGTIIREKEEGIILSFFIPKPPQGASFCILMRLRCIPWDRLAKTKSLS